MGKLFCSHHSGWCEEAASHWPPACHNRDLLAKSSGRSHCLGFEEGSIPCWQLCIQHQEFLYIQHYCRQKLFPFWRHYLVFLSPTTPIWHIPASLQCHIPKWLQVVLKERATVDELLIGSFSVFHWFSSDMEVSEMWVASLLGIRLLWNLKICLLPQGQCPDLL